jgi:hypothetical protein
VCSYDSARTTGWPADFFTGLIDTELAALGTDRATLATIRVSGARHEGGTNNLRTGAYAVGMRSTLPAATDNLIGVS